MTLAEDVLKTHVPFMVRVTPAGNPPDSCWECGQEVGWPCPPYRLAVMVRNIEALCANPPTHLGPDGRHPTHSVPIADILAIIREGT